MKSTLFLICLMVMQSLPVFLVAQDVEKNNQTEKPWAVGLVYRTASIPFDTEGGKTVSTVIPLLFYEGKYFYLRGIEGGFRFYRTGDWQFSALGRLRFFDIPFEYQNQVQGDNIDWGFQATYQPFPMPYLDLEILSDWEGNFSSNARLGLDIYTGGFHIDPFFEAKLKSKKFNSYYYGLNQVKVNPGIDLSAAVVVDYQLLSNFYLFGMAKLTLLDRQVRSSQYVNSDFHGQFILGFGLSNDRSKPRKEELSTKSYLRVAHGWATPTDLAQIIRFNAKKDTFNNQMTSVFYGHPLADQLFSLPIDIYITPGFVWHWASHVQSSIQELVIAIKLYYTIPWPIRWKFGAAEGLSWVNDIPYVEKSEMQRKGYRPSNLLNFLDFSLDFNIGDIFGGDELKKWWIGYSIHHRSAIFETAQQFGRIRGGSNFQTFYLQYDF
jgi:outer membrane protein